MDGWICAVPGSGNLRQHSTTTTTTTNNKNKKNNKNNNNEKKNRKNLHKMTFLRAHVYVWFIFIFNNIIHFNQRDVDSQKSETDVCRHLQAKIKPHMLTRVEELVPQRRTKEALLIRRCRNVALTTDLIFRSTATSHQSYKDVFPNFWEHHSLTCFIRTWRFPSSFHFLGHHAAPSLIKQTKRFRYLCLSFW